jgi:poly(hydroxyalkanoate) depolymerase family esterase
MKSTIVSLVVLGLIVGAKASFAASSPDGSGTWKESSYTNSYGTRAYALYVPKQVDGSHAVPLLVMLHGCGESASVFAQLTRMNTLADQRGFVVLYPQEDRASNSSLCWNWFSPDNFTRGGGELGIIMGMVDEVRKSIPIDSSRIGVAGFSAGAGLVSDLLACYSDVFSSAVVHSGLEYKAAATLNEAYPAMFVGPTHDLKPTALEAARCTGAGAKIARLLVIQGKNDTTVNPKNADRVVEQFSLVNDLLDDGQENGSQSSTALHSGQGQVPNGHSYQVSTYGGGGAEHIRKVVVDGMSHAWSGGTQGISFSDSQGPSASQMTVDLLFGQ